MMQEWLKANSPVDKEDLARHGKKRLVFAPMKYLDTDTLERYRIEYCQLPFEIYKFKE
jgi:adenine-specific DNA-methyltransferase